MVCQCDWTTAVYGDPQLTLSVVLGGLVVALLVELDGGEAPHLGVRQLVGGRVDLGL